MLDDIRNSIQDELDAVSTQIIDATQSNIPLVNVIGEYAMNQPGRKMIRPMMILLFAQALNYQHPFVNKLATIIELIHSATLLHDDVIDHANVRRSRLTTHKEFSGTHAILMGDFIYASAFKLISELESPTVTQILAKATGEIVEGEILQLSLQNQATVSLQQYHHIIRAKTALLFSTGAACIHALSRSSTQGNALHDYALHFGMLYQMTDDILDIDTENATLNKAHGTDLSEGKMTLPTLIAYQHASEEDQQTIEQILSLEQPWQNILPILKRTRALHHCQKHLDQHLQKGLNALTHLPDSSAKSHLINLIKTIPNRKI
jgi:octaprenyl-diphosphate synthase